MASAPGDQRYTFEEEALPHLDTVYRVALRLRGNEAHAQSPAHETMRAAYRAWHRLRPGTPDP